MAEILAFPLARRRDLIRRQAERFLDLGEHAGETNLFRLLQLQRDTLLRKGIEPEAVERQVQSLEGAIRAMAWHIVFTPEVTA